MTLNAAYKIIDKECDFLGRDFPTVMDMIYNNPGMFPQRVQNAYHIILLEEDCPVDEDPGAFSPDAVECF